MSSPVSRRSWLVKSPPLIPIWRWMRQTESSIPSASSACLPGQHVLVDAVDQRAVEIEQKDRLDAHRPQAAAERADEVHLAERHALHGAAGRRRW